MKKLILPLLLALLGLAGGVGAGIYLQPTHDQAEEEACACAETHSPDTGDSHAVDDHSSPDLSTEYEYVKLSNQFIVPIVKSAKVRALIVMSLSIEVTVGGKESVYSREPRLRDAFLQVLFDHANSNGFDGAFTGGEKMGDLRRSLTAAATKILGPTAQAVLVTGIVRQDV